MRHEALLRQMADHEATGLALACVHIEIRQSRLHADKATTTRRHTRPYSCGAAWPHSNIYKALISVKQSTDAPSRLREPPSCGVAYNTLPTAELQAATIETHRPSDTR